LRGEKMILIIGGAWQGKLSWAIKEYGLQPEEIWDLEQGYRAGYRCYTHLEALTRRGETAPFSQDAIIIAREIGSGVVPLDAADRLWRERHGALVQSLAAQAQRVVRMVCGLPEELK